MLLEAVAGRLSPSEARLLRSDRWSMSAIVLWEVAQLVRIVVDLDDAEVVRTLARVHLWPITREIARASTRLDVQSDPADELIAAANVPLVTRDCALRRSRLIPIA